LLSNLDAFNNCFWRVNSRSVPLRTLRPGAQLNIGGVTSLLEVQAGAAAGVEYSAEIVPRELVIV